MLVDVFSELSIEILRVLCKKSSVVIQNISHQVLSLVDVHFPRVYEVASFEFNVLLNGNLNLLELSIRNLRLLVRCV